MKSYFIKAILLCSVVYLTCYIIIYKSFPNVSNTKIIHVPNETVKNNSMKYILLWTSSDTVPFVDMGKKQRGFIERKCPHVNCYVTSNKSLLGDYTNFDVIAFAGPEISDESPKIILPKSRSAHQKYVFASIESPNYYPLCKPSFNGFFNWTWTYKLDSDVRWGYIVVRDMNNNIIGPKKDMNWLPLKEMNPVTEEFKTKLKTKKKAVTWFVSNCITARQRERIVQKLKAELSKYKKYIDIYGSCGNLQCVEDAEKSCDKMIANDYYFYLAFENSFGDDYVTEKVLHALNNNAVPIVFGGANYSRFMPHGIYLDARELEIEELAAKMNELINDPEKYAEYFRWKNHYSYHRTVETTETNEYCKFCEIMNNEEAVKKTTVYSDITGWWNYPNLCTNS